MEVVMRLVWALVVVGVGCGGQSNAPLREGLPGEAASDAPSEAQMPEGGSEASPLDAAGDAVGHEADAPDVVLVDASREGSVPDASADVTSTDAGGDAPLQGDAPAADDGPQEASDDAGNDGPTGVCFPNSMTCCYGGTLPCCCFVQNANEWLQECQSPASTGATCEQSSPTCVTPGPTGACPI